MSNFNHNFPKNSIPKTDFCNKNLFFFNTDINPPRTNVPYSKEIVYTFNEYGYRCENFLKKDINVISIGCSVTFGNGIPENKRFSNIFCSKISDLYKKEVSNWNMAFPGYSGDYVSRILSIVIPILTPQILIVNFPSLARREFFDIEGNLFDYRPDRDQSKLNKTQKFIFNNISNLTSDYQDAYNFYRNYKLIESLTKIYNIKLLFAIQKKDNIKYSILQEHFNNNIKSNSIDKIDFARDGGHPGILTNYNHGINYFNKYMENYV